MLCTTKHFLYRNLLHSKSAFMISAGDSISLGISGLSLRKKLVEKAEPNV